MNKITILENVKNESNYTIRLEFAIPIPASLQALENKVEILNSFKTKYKKQLLNLIGSIFLCFVAPKQI
mgnify:CR=1 FL=1